MKIGRNNGKDNLLSQDVVKKIMILYVLIKGIIIIIWMELLLQASRDEREARFENVSEELAVVV